MDRQKRKALADKVRYGHLRFEEGGAVTIASVIDRENNTLYYGCAYCNPKDQFIKKIGAWIAKDNLFLYLRDKGWVATEWNIEEKCGQILISKLENLRIQTIFDYLTERYSVYFPSWLENTLFGEENYLSEKREG